MSVRTRSLLWEHLAPLAVLAVLVGLAWLGWRRDVRESHDRIRITNRILATVVADRLSDYIDERAHDLMSLARARTSGQLETPGQYHEHVRSLRAHVPEYAGINFVDPRGIVVWSDEPAGFEKRAGVDLNSLPGRSALLAAASKGTAPVLSPAYRMLSGDLGLAIYQPVRRGRRLEGFFVAGVRGADLISASVPDAYRGKFLVDVREVNGAALAEGGGPHEDAEPKQTTVMGRVFEARVWPTAETRQTLVRPVEGRVFGTNVAFAVLISLLFWLALQHRRKALQRAEELKVTAEARRASQKRYADIVDRSPWVIIEHGPHGKIVGVNPAAEHLYRLRRDQMVGKDPTEWIHPDDRERTLTQIKAQMEGAALPQIENRNIDSGGGLHHMRWTGAQRFDDSGAPAGSISFGLDITPEVEAAEAQERLRGEEQRIIERLWVLNDFARSLRTTLDTASLYQIGIRAASNVLADRCCVIMTWDADSDSFTIAAVRSSKDTLPHFPIEPGTRVPSGDTDLGMAIREARLQVALDLAEAATPHERAIAAAGYHSRAAMPIVAESAPGGLLVTYRTEAGPPSQDAIEFMQGIAEHLALALTSSRLYGQLKQAYKELQDVQSQVVQMEKLRAVGEMASGIAHDFNNSLAAVLGYAELMSDEPLDEDLKRYVQIILNAAHDAAATVRRIQEYSRRLPEPDSFEEIDVSKLAHEALALTRHKWRDQAQSRGVTIKVEEALEPGLPPIHGNPSELREVLANLIFNAVDAMPSGGTVRVATGQRNGQVLLSVTDSGTGMTEEVRSHLFEPFFTTKGREGNGLGLSVSHGIVRRHGGELEVESELGKGTTFTLQLPPRRPAVPADALPAKPDGAPRNAHVLVIDDDPSVSGVVTALLERLGNTVETASTGDEGIQKLRQERFDVIFTDLGMPGMNGREVAAASKNLAPETAVVLLTGWGDQFRATNERPAGVDLVLGKPVRMEQLREALDRLLPADGHASNGGPK